MKKILILGIVFILLVSLVNALDIRECIYERQRALNHTHNDFLNENDLIDVNRDYTLGQLKNFVMELVGNGFVFLDTSNLDSTVYGYSPVKSYGYQGNPPPESVFPIDNVNTKLELIDLVSNYLTRTNIPSNSAVDYVTYLGNGESNEIAGAKSLALADFKIVTDNQYIGIHNSLTHDFNPNSQQHSYVASLWFNTANISRSGLYNDTDKKVVAWSKIKFGSSNGNFFHDFGTGFHNGGWQEILSQDIIGKDFNTQIYPLVIPTVGWGDNLPGGYHDSVSYGWRGNGLSTFLEWDFQCQCVQTDYYPDRDNDGAGDYSATPISGCAGTSMIGPDEIIYVPNMEDCLDQYPSTTSCVTDKEDCTWEYSDCPICIYPGSPYFLIEDINVFLNPDYVNTTQIKRKFTPSLPLTPYDNAIVELKVKECNSKSMITGGILNPNPDITSETHSAVGTFNYDRSVGGYNYYRWNLNGWDYSTGDRGNAIGWMQEYQMQELADPINELVVYVEKEGHTIGTKIFPISKCVRLLGDRNDHSIVTMSSEYVFDNKFSLAKKIIDEGFFQIDPFRKFKNKFSFYVDIIEIDDLNWETSEDGKHFLTSSYSKVRNMTNCNVPNPTFIFNNAQTWAAYTRKSENVIFANPPGIANIRLKYGETIIHEMGHSFCKLDDEYIINDDSPFLLRTALHYFWLRDKNCISNTPGCNSFWKQYGDCETGCNIGLTLRRPSSSSLMRCDTNKFNVVSCGYCLKKLVPSPYIDMEPYYEYCNSSNMDLIRSTT
jgi:hypothetical protein